MSNPLASILKEQSKYTYGDNGALELNTSGSSILDSFVNLLQDTDPDKIRDSVKLMVSDLEYSTDKVQHIHDIFILAFHKRSTSKCVDGVQISDGEGLKNVFYEYIIELYNYYPQTVIDIIRARDVFMYGYWKDALLIWDKINQIQWDLPYKFIKFNPLIEALRDAMLAQRSEDLDSIYNKFGYNTIKDMNETEFKGFLSDKKDTILNMSYIGKYCVRENSSFDKKAYWWVDMGDGTYKKINNVEYMIRKTLVRVSSGVTLEYPKHKNIPFGAKKIWRKDNVKLNVVLNVPENNFCSNSWGDIDIKNIPSICLKRKTKALLNEKLKEVNNLPEYEHTGNRYPDNSDRVECRQNIINHMTKSINVNCSQLFPHQIVGDWYKTISTQEQIVNKKLWSSLINYTKERLHTYLENNVDSANRSISSGNILCCADVSGSMTMGNFPNRPIDIAVALTAFISELANDKFKDIAMSFTDIPTIFNLKQNGVSMTMYDRIRTIMSHMGYSTNYIGIHECLIDLCRKTAVTKEELPVLVIFSDGHFNSQINVNGGLNGMTTHEYVVKMWNDAGYTSPPQIVYWNLAANKDSVLVYKSFPNVQLLSGAGVSNIKYVLYGEQIEEKTETVIINGVETQVTSSGITPELTMRKALDEPYFDSIRKVLKNSNEHSLRDYN